MSTSTTAASDMTTTTASTSLTQSIDKLDGSMASGKSNYQAWKFRITRILKEKGLLTSIEEDLDQADSKAIARDNAAFTILTLNVRDSQITHIQECATAKEAWNALQIVHQGIGASGRMVMMQRLWALRMVEGEDMAEHLNKFRELANQVESLSPAGKKMEETELVTLLSLSLPESFEPVIMALQSRADEITFDMFTSRLLQESARRQVVQSTMPHGLGQNSTGSAFSARVPGRGRSGGRYGRGRGGMRSASIYTIGRQEPSAAIGQAAGTSKEKGKCFYCQKEGHWKKDCNKRKANETKQASQPAGREQMGLAFTVQDAERTGTSYETWIIDSGASQHLCSMKNSFVKGTYREIPPRGIEIANGSRIEARGAGDVSLGQLLLHGVLYVPQAGGNLISVGRLIDSGFDIHFQSKRCIISKGELTLQGEREGNLYYLRAENLYDKVHFGLATNKGKPETIDLWHRRLGHRSLNSASVQYLQSHVRELAIITSTKERDTDQICETGAIGRQHKEAITGTREKTGELLGVVHSDICGPMQVSTLSGERYFITFIDEKSGRIAITLLKEKSEAFGAFQAYKARAEKEAERVIMVLRTDGGGEYTSQRFESYLRNCGIVHSISPPYTPSHNGLAERANRTLMESARCMIQEAELEKSFWGFAVATAAHIHNRLPSRSHGDKSPLEHWTGKVPSIGHLRVFGSVTFALVPEERRRKLDSRSVKCILLGYDENAGSKVYRVYSSETKRIFCSRDIVINERRTASNISDETESGSGIEIPLPAPEDDEVIEGEQHRIAEPIAPEEEIPGDELNTGEFSGDTIIVRPPAGFATRGEVVSGQQPRRSGRQRNLAHAMSTKPWRAMLAHLAEPQTLTEALKSDECEQWYEAWESEVDSLVRNKTWELVPLPAGREPIGCRWLFKKKDDGRYKARLVAKGYSQKAGIDYTETYAPVAKFSSLRSLLALVCEYDWELEGMDVKTAFLHSELEETVFMDIPEGLHTDMENRRGEERHACRLIKSIYGLKQSPRAWYGKINKFFLDHGFQRSEQDHNVYIHRILKLILLLYVDDSVITSPSVEDPARIQDLLRQEFEMTDLGPLTTFLGMEIQRNRKSQTLRLSQENYINTILDRHGMSTCSPIATPADPHVRLVKSPVEEQTDQNNQQRYQSAVGSLMYTMIGTRPDIAFAVSAVSQHSSNPGPSHWTALRRIFRYLLGTRTLGLTYGQGYCGGYTDADWGAGEDRKSTSGYAFMINGAAVSWASKKQQSVALSSTEAEYMALTQGVKESLWLGRLLEDLGAVKHQRKIQQMQCDNQGAIALTRNPEYHARTKHIDIQYHFIRQHVESRSVELLYCPTHEMTADIFTKPLARPQFQKHTLGLGLTPATTTRNDKSRKLNEEGEESGRFGIA